MKRLWPLAIVPILALALVGPASGATLTRLQLHLFAASPAITVSPSTVTVGQTVNVSGTGFNPHGGTAVVKVSIEGTTLNGSGSPVSSDGSFSASIKVPNLSPGAHSVIAEGFAPAAGATPTETPQSPATATETATTQVPTPVPPATVPTTAASATAVPTTKPTSTSTVASPTSTTVPSATSTTVPSPSLTPIPTASGVAVVVTNVLTIGISTSVPPPTRVPPTSTPTLSPTPTATATATMIPGNGVRGGLTYHMVSGAHLLKPEQLVFDGDRATGEITVTQITGPLKLSETASCASIPVVGTSTSCTIIETVTNTGPNTLDLSHTVINKTSSNVNIVSSTSTAGTTATSGSSVVWNNFQLAPGKSASATIQVSFTPTSAQVGSQVQLSDGVTATAKDVVTGAGYTVSLGALKAPSRVSSGSNPPATAVPGKPNTGTGSGAGTGGPGSTPTTGQSSTGTASSSVNQLPGTGGAARAFRSRPGG